MLIKVRNNSADEGGKWESYGIAKQSSCGLHFSHFPLFFHNVASSLPIIIPRVGEQVNSNFFYVVYISSKILQLTAGSRDLSQAEKILLLLQTKQLPKWQLNHVIKQSTKESMFFKYVSRYQKKNGIPLVLFFRPKVNPTWMCISLELCSVAPPQYLNHPLIAVFRC